MKRSKQIPLSHASDWKKAMLEALQSKGMSRYQFADAAAKQGICTQYTASSLVADDETVRGKRRPALDTAIDLARVAGCKIVFVMPDTKQAT